MRQCLSQPYPLGNLFFTPFTLKQRIRMLQKPASSRWALLRFAAILPLGLLLWMCTQSPTETTPAVPESETSARAAEPFDPRQEKIFSLVEEVPEFPGGVEALMKYLGNNLRYPEKAAQDGITGRVFVAFVVAKDGSIHDVNVLKGLSPEIDAEAVRVVKTMPKWKPARHEGQIVNVRFNLPINFQLD